MYMACVVCVVGLVFDESQPPDATLKPEKQKPKVTLAQDPKQAKVCSYPASQPAMCMHVQTHLS